MLDLRKFCNARREGERLSKLNTPYADADFVYACDGFISVRVPRATYTGAYAADLDATGINIFFKEADELRFGAVPEIGRLPQHHLCRLCHGTGLANPCSECQGMGELKCHHCGVERECGVCDGSGFSLRTHATGTLRCSKCLGAGRVIGFDEKPQVELGTSLVGFHYLFPWLEMRGLQFALVEQYAGKPLDPVVVALRFEGGIALIAQMHS